MLACVKTQLRFSIRNSYMKLNGPLEMNFLWLPCHIRRSTRRASRLRGTTTSLMLISRTRAGLAAGARHGLAHPDHSHAARSMQSVPMTLFDRVISIILAAASDLGREPRQVLPIERHAQCHRAGEDGTDEVDGTAIVLLLHCVALRVARVATLFLLPARSLGR